MRCDVIGCTLLAVSLLPGLGDATVLRVPEQYATIQMALDTLAEGDTVLVAPGNYYEALLAPVHSFALTGIVDSLSDPNRPLVDPSPLDGSRHLTCMTLSPHDVRIEDFIFRNGPEMYPREQPATVGGVLKNGANLTLTNCLFDSTFIGLRSDYPTSGLNVTNCDFRDNAVLCLKDLSTEHVSIRGTSFSGSGNVLVWVADSAVIDSCTFHDVTGFGEWLWPIGRAITVRNCEFGPSLVRMNAAIWAGDSRGCHFENNLFHDLEVSAGVVQVLGMPGDTTFFDGNVFSHCRGDYALLGGGGISLDGQGGPMNVAISNSTFDSCTAPHNMGYGAIVAGQASSVMSDNHFNGHNIPAPTVRFVFSPNTTLHQCTFERTGWAMSADTDWYNPDSVWHISAEDNWWGDPSGPRHSILNPTGLGDSIVGPVNFSPWLTEDPLSSPKPRGLFPSGFVLESYPEPFNLEVRLKLTVADPGRYKLELFDLLGRRVREIWEGSVVFDREVSFSTDNLASGVYFACATESSSRLPVVTTKLVLLK